MKIALLVPTRGRPKNIERLIQSVYKNTKDVHNVCMVFYADYDDPETAGTIQKFIQNPPPTLGTGDLELRLLVGPRIVLSQMWNECCQAAPEAEIFHHCADDVVFQTPGWDERVREEFEAVPDRILFLFGRDGIVDDARLGTHGFIHRNWVNTIGYFVPPYFSYCYNDTWLTEVATRIGRLKYIPDIKIGHYHPGSPNEEHRAPMDQTYMDAANRGSADDCLGMYKAKDSERAADAEKLMAFITGF